MKWDRGVKYPDAYKQLVRIINENKEKQGERAARSLAIACILLVQLRNGSRVSEAHEALMKYLQTKEIIVTVRVRKQKHPEERKMYIPKEVRNVERSRILGAYPSVANVEKWCERHIGFNTHSLRYAWITEAARRHIAPQIIAKVTGHKTLNMILGYTQQKAADDLLENFDEGL
ncbi:MAG: integrase [Nitrososphaeria archaeon]